MPSELRRSRPGDTPELLAMAERCLGVTRENPMFSRRHMQWKYWSECSDTALCRGYVLERDGRIVAHAGVVPVSYRRGESRLTLLHPFDWMSEPSAIGSGAALLKRLSSLADGLLIVGGSETTRRMVGPLGFQEAGSVLCFTAPASPFEMPPGCRVQKLEALEDEVPRGAGAGGGWLLGDRSPLWLEACRACPEAPMAVYTAHQGDSPLGGFVACAAPGEVRLVAFWFASERPAAQALLLRAARAASVTADADAIVSMANAPHDRQALGAAGFHAVRQVPMFVFTRPRLDAGERLPFQMIDGDVAFLHHGAPAPWVPDGSLPELTGDRP